MRSRVRLLAAVLASQAASAAALATSFYDVTDIGGWRINPRAINNHNEVVGYALDAFPERHAFYWSPDTGLSSLGGFSASDINDAGQIAGNSDWYQAAVWDNGSWILLENRQSAAAINDQGQVTGLISSQPDIVPGLYAPFRDDDIYTPGFMELERPSDSASQGLAINSSGQVVAWCGSMGVFYEADGMYTVLDSANRETFPLAINEGGQIAGYAQQSSSAKRFPAFWPFPSSPIQSMGTLGTGDGRARGMNNRGQAVGVSSGRAFLWSVQSGIMDLNGRIDPALGITLTDAYDINEMGSIIALGVDQAGEQHSYLLTPEPATFILLAAGCLAWKRESRIRIWGQPGRAGLQRSGGRADLGLAADAQASPALPRTALTRVASVSLATPARTPAPQEFRCRTPGGG